ncbi:MAG: hypothetical protein Tsb0021_03340 [Chlamydiales bacterium]
MTTLNNLNNIDKCINFLNQPMKVKGINWKGEKCFVYNNQTTSLSEIVEKINQIYQSEYFPGALLTKTDSEKLITIKNKIQLLKNEKLDISLLTKIYVVTTQIIKRIFSFRITSETTILINKIETKAKEALKSFETTKYKKSVKIKISENVKTALKYAYDECYSVPYKDTHIKPRELKKVFKGETVHRYNHGSTHTTRKVFYIPYVVEYFSRHANSHLAKQFKKELESSSLEDFIQKLQIAIIFEVAGRESEFGWSANDPTYDNYLKSSAEKFKAYCIRKELVGKNKLFRNSEELERYALGIKEKYPNRIKQEKDMDLVASILDTTHSLDLARCYWPSAFLATITQICQNYSNEKNNQDYWELTKFSQSLIRATGDRLTTELTPESGRRGIATNSAMSVALYRNRDFKDQNAFLNCSKDPDFCLNILKKVPSPVSFSHGETTYDYVKSLQKERSLEKNTTEKALNLIKEGNAAIRLISTQKDKLDREIKMLNDPVFFRPLRDVKDKRDFVVENRNDGKVIERGFKPQRISLEQQINGPLQEKKKIWEPVHKNEERGLPKYTEYTKKLSLSLLRSDGKVNHFKGEFPRGYGIYRQIGFLYDIEDLGQKDEKYIFDKDVGTSDKFWIGENANAKLDRVDGRKEQITLKDLKEKLAQEVHEKKEPRAFHFLENYHAPNELLMGLKKKAIKGIFTIEDSPNARVNAFIHALYLSQDYGIHVPVLIVDGKSEPKSYARKQLKEDLEILYKSRSFKNKKTFNELYSCFCINGNIQTGNQEKYDLLYEKSNQFLDQSSDGVLLKP